MPRVRPPLPELLKFLSAYDDSIAALALAVRKKILTACPKATESIVDAYNAVAIGYSFTGRLKESFFHIAVYEKYVNLGFNRGVHLPDPHKLLHGTGNNTRHVTIRSAADLNDPRLAKLIRAAIDDGHLLALSSKQPIIEPQSMVKAIYPTRRRPAKKASAR
jgi:hypothetical protein